MYDAKKNGLDKAIAGLTQHIAAAEEAVRKASEEIRQLERRTTSVQPTVDAINATLRSFGYTNFSLATSEDGKRSEEHTSELQTLMRISYAVFCLQKTKPHTQTNEN